ncbi:muscarinic acetylcholine receptor M1-like [Rhopilema esculentum]|uniref:muscarinic acetylcholine receptor M1-like n=1 Tax=Rhopilema esculentum TaxID=499914 RepID=UPI0031DE7AE9|eukprot:gene11252-21441_t
MKDENGTNELTKNLTQVVTGILSEMTGRNAPKKEYTGLGLSPTTIIIVTTFLCFVIVVAVVGNVIALVALHVCRELRDTTCYFITNLCISDLLVSFLSLPFWISFIQSGWPSKEDGLVYKLWICLDIFCGSFSISNLVLISIERYIYIVYPLNFESIITKRRAKWLTAATPVYGIIASMIGFVRMMAKNPYLIIPVVFLTYVIPVAVMCFANGNTYLVTMSHFKFIEQQEKDRRRLISLGRVQLPTGKAQTATKQQQGDKEASLNKNMPKKGSRCFSLESRTRQETIAIADENETSKQHLHETIPCLLETKTKSQLALIKIEGIKEWEDYVSQIESSGKMRNRTDETEEEDEHGLGDSKDEKVLCSNDCCQEDGNVNRKGQGKIDDERVALPKKKKQAASSDRFKKEQEKEKLKEELPESGNTVVTKSRCMWRLRGIKRELKAAKAIALIIGTFLLLWTPFMVVVLLTVSMYKSSLRQP